MIHFTVSYIRSNISAWELYTGNADRIQEALDIKGGNDEKTTFGPVVDSRHRRGRLLQDE